ncbi:MAG: hypothetical protein ACUBOA_14645 [Candidatus Loosdrechtia sp.]|uniref:hypothetical protein n=1 Tax=Candidatus Loosdrechtia sp. TaxID=3101272 RepID=UPI003A63143C|nr:MAG: hypothetical protein QY305_04440 [Candidatus Jettenia sp. AMX2]
MKWLYYLMPVCIVIFACILTGKSIISGNMVFAEERVTGTVRSVEDINSKKDEITEQLQAMKAFFEQMKKDYDAKFEEMLSKITTLEREKEELEIKMQRNEEMFIVTGADTKTSVKPETEKPVMPQRDPIADTPLSTQSRLPSLAESMITPAETTTGRWSPTDPIYLWRSGQSFVDISFIGLFSLAGSTSDDLEELQVGAHDPIQRGFTVQQLEMAFEGVIDPFFKGNAYIIFQIDREGESFLEIEEAYLTSLSLPLNLQAKAGTFFTEFGRLNPTHPHVWDFADAPLVSGRFMGPDGMRNPGARISWLAPTPNYTELFFTVQNSHGETVRSFRFEDGLHGRQAFDLDDDEMRVRSMKDLLYTPRIVTAFDLTDEQTLMLGASAAFGPNSTGRDKRTIIYGADVYWKWKSRYSDRGFPFVTWQTEVMGRRFEAGPGDPDPGDPVLPDEVIRNWGVYSQATWGFRKGWVAGLRGDYVDGERFAESPLESERWRLSPNLTFYPSEFSKIRLQYNYDRILGGEKETEHSVFLQFEFLLGAHGAHKF